MSVDYSNYKVWREQELRSKGVNLDEYTEYKIDELTSLFSSLLKEALYAGLENCFLRFESRLEPYEDYLGAPFVFPCGYRKVNDREKQELKEDSYILELAKEKGITPYEARDLLSLAKKGVVKL